MNILATIFLLYLMLYTNITIQTSGQPTLGLVHKQNDEQAAWTEERDARAANTKSFVDDLMTLPRDICNRKEWFRASWRNNSPTAQLLDATRLGKAEKTKELLEKFQFSRHALIYARDLAAWCGQFQISAMIFFYEEIEEY